MFHNGDDISAYLDGELPADAARELERKLETDITAREELERLRGLKTTMHDAETPDFESSQRRVWMSLESRLGLGVRLPVWRRRVSVPLPAVAAAAVAVFALAGLLLWFAGPALTGAGDIETAGAPATDAEVRIAVGGADGEELLGWLEEQGLTGDVSVQLPETARFEIMGEPQLMRAAEHRSKRGSPDS
jgi:anti-sigma factor RsiW